jgi:hypothetical protein
VIVTKTPPTTWWQQAGRTHYEKTLKQISAISVIMAIAFSGVLYSYFNFSSFLKENKSKFFTQPDTL